MAAGAAGIPRARLSSERAPCPASTPEGIIVGARGGAIRKTRRRAPAGRPAGSALPMASVDEFVERFAVNLSRGGLFVRARDPRPVGTLLALGDPAGHRRAGDPRPGGGPLGPERARARPSASAAPRRAWASTSPSSTTPSQAVVERMVSLRERRGLAPGTTPPAPVAARARPDAALRAAALAPLPPPAPPPSPRHPPCSRRRRRPTPAPAPAADGLPPAAPGGGPDCRSPGQPGLPAQANLSLPHRIEQLSTGPARVAIDLPPGAGPGHPALSHHHRHRPRDHQLLRRGGQGRQALRHPLARGLQHRPLHRGAQRPQPDRRRPPGHGRSSSPTRARRSGAPSGWWGAPTTPPVVQDIKSKFAYEIVAGPEGLAAVKLGPARSSPWSRCRRWCCAR